MRSPFLRKPHEPDKEPSDSELVEQFRSGAKNSVCRLIWHSVRDRFYQGIKQADIAARLQVHPSNVNRWQRGEMSFELLVSILADSQKQWEDLPDRPQNQNLRIGGFTRILTKHFLDHPQANDEAVVLVATEIVCCLVALMQHQTEWRHLNARQSAESPRLSQLAEKVAAEADGIYRQYLGAIPFRGRVLESTDDNTITVQFRSVEDLNHLDAQFGDVWDHFEDADMAWQDEDEQ